MITTSSNLGEILFLLDAKQDSDVAFQYFLEKGVILRSLKVYEMPQHLRVSIGTEEEMDFFLQVLEDYEKNLSKNKNNIQFLIIGLGLIGGSVAKRLSKNGFEVLAIDKNKSHLKHAKKSKNYSW